MINSELPLAYRLFVVREANPVAENSAIANLRIRIPSPYDQLLPIDTTPKSPWIPPATPVQVKPPKILTPYDQLYQIGITLENLLLPPVTPMEVKQLRIPPTPCDDLFDTANRVQILLEPPTSLRTQVSLGEKPDVLGDVVYLFRAEECIKDE